MPGVKVRIKSSPNVFKRMKRRFPNETRRALEDVAIYAVRRAKMYAPKSKGEGGGTLQRNIRKRRVSAYQWLLAAETSYALFVEKGVKPHPIIANRARLLRFEVNGQVFYRRKVKHPGFKGRRFMQRAITDAYHYQNRRYAQILRLSAV